MSEIKKHHWTTTKLIVFGYLAVITTGTLLLMLPVSNRQMTAAPFMDAWFTATSATCVTGLVLHDTYSFWSPFGQSVILLLIQIGGIGFMTIAISALTITKRKIGLSQRLLMQESMAAPQVGVLKRIVVIDVGEGPIVLINPEIIETSGEQSGEEGCLSVPGKSGLVTRPDYVKVRALNEDMEEIELEGEGLLARAFCHEIDHLDGKMYVDLVEGELHDVNYEEEA